MIKSFIDKLEPAHLIYIALALLFIAIVMKFLGVVLVGLFFLTLATAVIIWVRNKSYKEYKNGGSK